MTEQQCPQPAIDALLALTSEAKRTSELERLLAAHPADARLHFLKGSWLAGRGDVEAARMEMKRAVELAPHYGIARFQLGLLLLSSGEPIQAQEAWGPLHGLPKKHFLHLFVTGLTHLIHDQFDAAVAQLEEGIVQNRENLPMNADMQLLIDTIMARPANDEKVGASGVDFLLRQATLRTRH